MLDRGYWTMPVMASVIALVAGNLLAYPSAPVPLLELCRQADTIVVADAVGFVGDPAGHDEQSYAELRVKTVCATRQLLRVGDAQPYAYQCPAPACYPQGGWGIAFLRHKTPAVQPDRKGLPRQAPGFKERGARELPSKTRQKPMIMKISLQNWHEIERF